MVQRLQQFSVYALITKDNQLLLVQKNRGPYKGLWDLPGGKIEFGEEPETTLIREVLEETGLEIESQSFLKSDSVVVNYTDETLGKVTLHHVGFIFKIKVKDMTYLTPKQDDEELVCTKWCQLDEIELETVTPFLQELLIDSPVY